MIDVIEISIEEFKKDFYDKYIKLFPKDEQRDWKKVEDTYSKGIEHFYKIVLDNEIIGFFMLERIDDVHPYYLDYFAIYEEYQNKGYGKLALELLLNNIILNNGLIAEIEKVDNNNLATVKRLKFYEELGFKKIESEYLLYNVLYTPIIYLNSKKYSNDEVDKLFFDYYRINVGEKELKINCKILNKQEVNSNE